VQMYLWLEVMSLNLKIHFQLFNSLKKL